MRITPYTKALHAIKRTERAQRARRMDALATRNKRDAIACGLDDARDWCAINDAIGMAADEHAEWQAIDDARELEALRDLHARVIWDEIARVRDEELSASTSLDRKFVSKREEW